MELSTALYPLVGGSLIGLAVTLMLLFNGRVTGVSGIIASAFSKPTAEGLWRLTFLAGLVAGGVIMKLVEPEFFTNLSGRGAGVVAIAGFLVGYGTVMGSGCTSGHGVCGISRFSLRSMAATMTFILFGLFAVQAFRYFGGAV